MNPAELQEPSASPGHLSEVRVRYAETDQMGVVYHANYLVWMEIGRVELVRSRGVDYADLEKREGLMLAVVDVQCRYLFPARYDDVVQIVTRVLTANPRTITFSYEIRLTSQNRILATGQTRHIWLNREMRPSRLPETYSQLLQLG